jgi:hypothetical protein
VCPHHLRVNISPSINGDHTIVVLPNNGYQYRYTSSKGLVQINMFTEVRTKTRKREAGQKNKPSLLKRKKEGTKKKPATISIDIFGESNPGPFELVETEL